MDTVLLEGRSTALLLLYAPLLFRELDTADTTYQRVRRAFRKKTRDEDDRNLSLSATNP